MKKLVFVLISGFAFSATPPNKTADVPKIPEKIIADFWRAKANKVQADAMFDAAVTAIRNICGHDGTCGPDGHPSCGPETPTSQTPVPPAEPSKAAAPNGK